ncbi:MAG: hypothetical protein ACT4O1_18225 [Gemmatimonadota bacterium]
MTVRADTLPQDEVGWVLATRRDLPLPAGLDPLYPFERHVLHVEPGRDPNEFSPVQLIVDGNVTDWNPAVITALWPNSAYVLEAEYELGGDLGRCKVVEVPLGATVLATNIVSHKWMGDD